MNKHWYTVLSTYVIFDPISNGVNKIGDFFLLPLSLCIVHSINIILAIFQLFNSARKQTMVSISVSRGSKNRCEQRQIIENSMTWQTLRRYFLLFHKKQKWNDLLIYSKLFFYLHCFFIFAYHKYAFRIDSPRKRFQGRKEAFSIS